MALKLHEVKQFGRRLSGGKIQVQSTAVDAIGVKTGINNLQTGSTDGVEVWLKVVYRDDSFRPEEREVALWSFDNSDNTINRVSVLSSSRGGDGVDWDTTKDLIIYSVDPPGVVNVENWHNVGHPNEPAFLNGWVNIDIENAGHNSARFKKTPDGVVYLIGFVKDGSAANANIFILPEGYRPAEHAIFAQWGEGAILSRLEIQLSGNVGFPFGGGTTAGVSLCCSFMTGS